MSALERVDTAGVHLPPALAGTGIRIVEKNGVRGVDLPPALFENYNVVSPTTQIAAADPMWSPSIALIHLDPQTHGYKGQRNGETALAKNGILALADGAGIQIRTRRMARNELRDCEIGWTATALIRQSDGTLKELEASKVMDLDFEREAINAAAANENAARGRWLNERPHFDAKCETKAMLRAIRAAMQLRHALPTEQFKRPWLVIRIGFTPDPDNPAVRNAVAQLYGTNAAAELDAPRRSAGELSAPAVDDDTGEVLHGEVVDPPAPAPAPAPEAEADPDAEYEAWRAQQEEAAAPADDGAASSWQSIIDSAGPTQIQFGKMKGLCIGDAFKQDASYLTWLIGSQFTPKTPDQERAKAHARDFLQAATALGLVGGTGDRS